jgi:hypothetical protein
MFNPSRYTSEPIIRFKNIVDTRPDVIFASDAAHAEIVAAVSTIHSDHALEGKNCSEALLTEILNSAPVAKIGTNYNGDLCLATNSNRDGAAFNTRSLATPDLADDFLAWSIAADNQGLFWGPYMHRGAGGFEWLHSQTADVYNYYSYYQEYFAKKATDKLNAAIDWLIDQIGGYSSRVITNGDCPEPSENMAYIEIVGWGADRTQSTACGHEWPLRLYNDDTMIEASEASQSMYVAIANPRSTDFHKLLLDFRLTKTGSLSGTFYYSDTLFTDVGYDGWEGHCYQGTWSVNLHKYNPTPSFSVATLDNLFQSFDSTIVSSVASDFDPSSLEAAGNNAILSGRLLGLNMMIEDLALCVPHSAVTFVENANLITVDQVATEDMYVTIGPERVNMLTLPDVTVPTERVFLTLPAENQTYPVSSLIEACSSIIQTRAELDRYNSDHDPTSAEVGVGTLKSYADKVITAEDIKFLLRGDNTISNPVPTALETALQSGGEVTCTIVDDGNTVTSTCTLTVDGGGTSNPELLDFLILDARGQINITYVPAETTKAQFVAEHWDCDASNIDQFVDSITPEFLNANQLTLKHDNLVGKYAMGKLASSDAAAENAILYNLSHTPANKSFGNKFMKRLVGGIA